MEATENKTPCRQKGPTFPLNKKIMPIDEYAKREGITKEIVANCGKLGIIPIRKYKGRLYVVDLPISPYEYASMAEEKANSAGTREVRPSKVQRSVTGPGLAAPTTRTGRPAAICDAAAPAPATYTMPSGHMNLPPAGQKPASKQASKSPVISVDDEFRLKVLSIQARSRRLWQITALVSLLCCFMLVVAGVWFSMGRRIQFERAQNADAMAVRVHNDFVEAKGQIAGLRGRLVDTVARFEGAQIELRNASKKMNALDGKLTAARRDLKLIQRHYSETVRQMDQRIEALTGKLNSSAAAPQTNQNSQTQRQPQQ